MEAAPAHVQIGLCGEAVAGVGVRGGPVGDAGVGAVGNEGGVGVDVGDESVEGVDGVREDAAGGQVLG